MRKFGLLLASAFLLAMSPGVTFAQATQGDADTAIASSTSYFNYVVGYLNSQGSDYNGLQDDMEAALERWADVVKNNPFAGETDGDLVVAITAEFQYWNNHAFGNLYSSNQYCTGAQTLLYNVMPYYYALPDYDFCLTVADFVDDQLYWGDYYAEYADVGMSNMSSYITGLNWLCDQWS